MKIIGGLQCLLLAGAFVLAAAGGAIGGSPPAIHEQTLYKFCSQTNCTDGAVPQSGLIMDGAGNLYGTTTHGGSGSFCSEIDSGGCGSSTGWIQTVLYAFCAKTNCSDGAFPRAELIMDAAGNLYGTTGRGSTPVGGTVFKLAPSNTGWTETVLYAFCAQAGCKDGDLPQSGLIMDGAGNLYGTTTYGGSVCSEDGMRGCGTVFKLAPSSTGWTETVLYSFCAQYPCPDGAYPYAGVIMDGAGNLYGTTDSGGGHNHGTVFKLAPTGSGWTEAVLYAFCGTNCSDGGNPDTGVIMDALGNLYGTTGYGGNSCSLEGVFGCGTVFQLTATGSMLSVSVIGNPGGKVTSSPAGIDCESTCSASFSAGTQVTLTATPAIAWGLSGRDGACSGIGGCTVTLNASTSVSASFTTLFTAPQALQPDPAALPPPVMSPLPAAPTAF